jgi:hypothetical protein
VYFLINLPNLSILRKLHNKFNILQKYACIEYINLVWPTPWHSWSKCLKRPFISFYPKVQHKYSQKHYHQILICKYLTQNMFLKHYLKTTPDKNQCEEINTSMHELTMYLHHLKIQTETKTLKLNHLFK